MNEWFQVVLTINIKGFSVWLKRNKMIRLDMFSSGIVTFLQSKSCATYALYKCSANSSKKNISVGIIFLVEFELQILMISL